MMVSAWWKSWRPFLACWRLALAWLQNCIKISEHYFIGCLAALNISESALHSKICMDLHVREENTKGVILADTANCSVFVVSFPLFA